MKKILLLFTLLFAFFTINAQSIFKPVTAGDILNKSKALKVGESVSTWFPRLSAGVIANQFTYEDKKLVQSAFSKVGLGISYVHYILVDGEPYNNFSVNGFVFLPVKEPESGLSLAATISALQYINLGFGYDFGLKRVFGLTGISYTF